MPAISRLPRFLDITSRSEPVIKLPEARSLFSLDSSGVAGFFGGDGAVVAMATVHLLPFRAWGGWYNSPGSYEIAKRYGQLANSRFWDGLFPGSNTDPAEFFELNGKIGPRRFIGAHSGTSLSPTGHLAYLLSRQVQAIKGIDFAKDAINSSSTYVTIIHLLDTPGYKIKAPRNATRALRYSGFLAAIPIAASLTACIMCALVKDWYCFTCITFGILAGGIACAIIGSGELIFDHPNAARSAPHGDGIMWGDKEVIVLLGPENAVNVFTRGGFSLRFGDEPEEGAIHSSIGWCSILLTIQFLIQLLLIPQGTLFGQIMFVASLAVSSFDKEELQMGVVLHHMPQLARDIAQHHVKRFRLPSWRTAAVLSLLLLDKNSADGVPNPSKILDELLPNDTPVWREWKKKVVQSFTAEGAECEKATDEPIHLRDEEKMLLNELFRDADIVHREWQERTRAGIVSTPVCNSQ